ncbi:MAG: metal ABC transporter ATP-binding protein [Sulfurihydrogenibium sp.]|uniref:metal ABC transporter ATP-binding protein n=1 Tax=Sulfurihydrogenibium sp. TaxID=2053621 RepID=UPI000CB55160|nr:MAG: metal ABC transporter ATP-binding protein [Sulfurihydrogenibium sp.]
MIKIENLWVELNGNLILEDISLEIKKGEIVAIVGPNGGGKTTLIRTILGFVKPTKGRVLIDGKEPKDYIKSGKVGYLPQKSSYERDFPVSALDVVMFGLVEVKISKKEKEKKALEVLRYVGMESFKDKPFGKLSGGQQQRVMIARAIISEPELLILDEPSTGVDVVAQESFYEFIKKLNQEKGITVLMITHDIGAVGSFVHKVVGLNKKLHYFGDFKDFLQKSNVDKLYGSEVKLLIHSPECFTCQYFNVEVKKH